MIETINAYDKLINQLNSFIRSLKIYPKVFTESEHEYLHPFFDKMMYNTLSLSDLVIGLKYLDVNQALKSQIEANYFARIVALSSYEIINDVNKLGGQKIRRLVIEKIGDMELTFIDEELKKLNQIKKLHKDKLKEIRNNLIGHKLEEGHRQSEMIISVDNKEIYDIGNSIHKIQFNLIIHYMQLIEKI